jgi:UTP--glucose-1-phosphate uridylyltransferase
MVEKPKPEVAPSIFSITGRYILQPEIFKYLEKFQVGSGGEIQLTDAMKEMCKDYPFYYKIIDELRFDCGNVLGYLEANIAFALQDEKVSEDVKKMLKKYSQ